MLSFIDERRFLFAWLKEILAPDRIELNLVESGWNEVILPCHVYFNDDACASFIVFITVTGNNNATISKLYSFRAVQSEDRPKIDPGTFEIFDFQMEEVASKQEFGVWVNGITSRQHR